MPRGGNPKTMMLRHVIAAMGQRFGRLVALAPAGKQGNEVLWMCRCDCGKYSIVAFGNLGRTTKSCGCLARELSSIREKTHGMVGTPEHTTWKSMITRCTNPESEHWKDYGGRGIKVCGRWLTFENFYADMGKRPKGYTLDRKEVNGHYEPENCKWSEKSEQRRNSRRVSIVGFSQYKGVFRQKNRWIASISIKNKTKYLGSYHDEREAALIYDKKAIEVYGEDAVTNASLGRL